MDAIIIYASHTAGPGRQTVFYGEEKAPLFLRLQRIRRCDSLEALRKAKPREDEIVLNTIETNP